MLLIAHVQKSVSHSSFQIIPSRLQLFEYQSVSFTCEGLNDSAGWKVRNTRGIVNRCSNGTVKTCSIDYAFASDTGEYWCESGAERSNTVNINVSTGSVILESSVYSAVEGDAMSLHCKSKTASSNLTAEFYKDNVLVGSSYDGKLKIQKVSKSHEGLYKCKLHGVGESPESWMVIRLKSSTGGGVPVTLKNPDPPVTERSHREFPLSHLYYILLWAAVATVLALQLLVLGLLYWKKQLVVSVIKMNESNKYQDAVPKKPRKNRGTETAADNLSFCLEADSATNPQTGKDRDELSPHMLHSTFMGKNTPQFLQNESGGCGVQAGLSDPRLTYQRHQRSTIKWENHRKETQLN
ncbi:low affinity immunoglobulin gamma Fc region receptor II-b-like [Archocentrus centrarchus]|uniref:low affinity immunoglobulin gamma Fc region receptor II-b-like n=1 Tax=Archocentrus centrarchus TaxID=63155 RepID=UPI0011EA194A|nr:low affinity immunoglobulin gamma Fc region receptor II-b-like [Archocentrus centrarchus]